MSENPMDGFGSPGPELPEEASGNGRDPKVLIGVGVGLAAVAAVGAFLFFGGGSSGSSTPAAAAPVSHVVPTVTNATVIPVGKPTPAVRTFDGDVGRDPFAALITSPPAPTTTPVVPKPAVTVTVAPTTAPGGVVGIPGLPTLPVTVSAPSTVISTTTPPPAVLVVLKAIAFKGTTPIAVITFAGHSYALKTGDTAGTNLKVLAIAPDDGTVTFQLGDQPFDLHIGQSYVD